MPFARRPRLTCCTAATSAGLRAAAMATAGSEAPLAGAGGAKAVGRAAGVGGGSSPAEAGATAAVAVTCCVCGLGNAAPPFPAPLKPSPHWGRAGEGRCGWCAAVAAASQEAVEVAAWPAANKPLAAGALGGPPLSGPSPPLRGPSAVYGRGGAGSSPPGCPCAPPGSPSRGCAGAHGSDPTAAPRAGAGGCWAPTSATGARDGGGGGGGRGTSVARGSCSVMRVPPGCSMAAVAGTPLRPSRPSLAASATLLSAATAS
jgi:hypothetical protein